MDLNEWIITCRKIANEHGFYVVWDRQENHPMNPIEALAKIMTESGEAIEAYVSQTKPNNGTNKVHCDNWKELFNEEIADLTIRTFHLCGDLNIDLEKIMEKKKEYNKDRPYKHGKLT